MRGRGAVRCGWDDRAVMLLCRQLVVLHRQQVCKPRPTWADRVIVALTSVISRPRRAGLRLLVTPDTISRWHSEPLCRRRAARWARAAPAARPLDKTPHPRGHQPGERA